MLRVLPALIELALLLYALIDCIQSPDAQIRNLPKWGWLVLIILVPYIGPIAWLVAGRPSRAAAVGGSGPWPAGGAGSTRSPGYPAGSGGPRSAPVGPDDDPEFLRGLGRVDAEHEDVLRQWEEDLRRREEQLRGPGAADAGPTPTADPATDPTRDSRDDEAPPAS